MSAMFRCYAYFPRYVNTNGNHIIFMLCIHVSVGIVENGPFILAWFIITGYIALVIFVIIIIIIIRHSIIDKTKIFCNTHQMLREQHKSTPDKNRRNFDLISFVDISLIYE